MASKSSKTQSRTGENSQYCKFLTGKEGTERWYSIPTNDSTKGLKFLEAIYAQGTAQEEGFMEVPRLTPLYISITNHVHSK